MGIFLEDSADELAGGVADWRQEIAEPVCLWSGKLIQGKLRDFNCSPGIETITGWKPEQFYSRDKSRSANNLWFQIVHPEDREEHRAAWHAAQQGNENQIEYRIIHANREIRWVNGYQLAFRRDGHFRFAGTISDITERKQAEEEQSRLHAAVQKAAVEWRLMFDAVESTIVILDLEGRIERMNRVARELSGNHYNDNIGRRVETIGRGQPWQKAAALVSMIQKTRSATFCEVRDAADGRTWEIAASLFTGAGVDERIVLVCREISERKRVEEALRESEDRHRDLVENSKDLICTHDLEGRILSANQSSIRLLGYEASGFVGKRNMCDILAPESRDQFDDYIARIKRDGTASGLMIVQTSSGERRFWEYNNTLRTEGVSLPIVRGMAQDITERKRAEEEAREQQAYFQQLFESSPEGILILDEKGRILAANKGFEKIFQYHIEEIRAHYVDELIVPPEHSDEASAVLEAILRGEVVQKESVRSRKDGNRVDVVLIGYPIVLNGKVLGTYMIYSDISARKRAEETLRRSEVMSAMGSLVGAVAHEVRNPLFCISSTLDAFEARFGAREEYQRYTAILRGELNRLTELMQELLDYGRPPELERSASAIQDVIAQAISSCEPLLERSKVSVSNTIGTQLAPLLVDRRRLQQVFQNLIDNSIRHSPSGAVVLLEAEEVHQDNQIWLECSVKDSGPGFKAEDLSRVFEPFFTRRRGGTGLGLSIVQRIVEQHGGKISAANRPEGGAVMTVKLPLFAE